MLALSEKEKQAAQRLQKDGEPNSLPDISSTDNGSRSQILPAVVNPELNLKSKYPRVSSIYTSALIINRGVPSIKAVLGNQEFH